MSWLSEQYLVWIIATNDTEKLHDWHVWEPLYKLIDPLIELSNYKAAIRTSQSFKDQSSWLGFGRMVWSEKNNIKWTSKYKAPEFSGREYEFFSTEIWAPDWNVV